MTTLPFNGKVHLISGQLAYLTKLHGVEPVRDALYYHQMTPAFHDAAAVMQHIEDNEHQPTTTQPSCTFQ